MIDVKMNRLTTAENMKALQGQNKMFARWHGNEKCECLVDNEISIIVSSDVAEVAA